MSATPLLEESCTGPGGAMLPIPGASDPRPGDLRERIEAMADRRVPRTLAIYPASAGFELVEELEHLCQRSIEPNVFFNPRFLAPAMPRLDDREVRLAVIRDGAEEGRSRLRLLVPFSIEKPPLPLGVPVMRVWSSPFSPLGTPLVDHDDPVGVVEDFFSILSRPHLKLPQVLMLPEMRLDGPFAAMLNSLSASRELPLAIVGRAERPFLQSDLEGPEYLRAALRPHHLREYQRLRRRLGELGRLEHRIARSPDEVRTGTESFLALEAAGWKGRGGSAMASDRYRAAFAREAVHLLAERDLCRVHSLALDGRTIACIVVFVENGVAYTWKTAYDEGYAAFSPGTLLMIDVTHSHLEDPNIVGTDSCAMPDHPVMSRLWTERRPLGTVVVGLAPQTDRVVRQAASQIHLYRETRNLARMVRSRMRNLARFLPGRSSRL